MCACQERGKQKGSFNEKEVKQQGVKGGEGTGGVGRGVEAWGGEWRCGKESLGKGSGELGESWASRSKMYDICVWKSHNDLYALSKKTLIK